MNYFFLGVEVLRNKVYRNLDINEVVNIIVYVFILNFLCDRYLVGKDVKYVFIWFVRLLVFVVDFFINIVFDVF